MWRLLMTYMASNFPLCCGLKTLVDSITHPDYRLARSDPTGYGKIYSEPSKPEQIRRIEVGQKIAILAWAEPETDLHKALLEAGYVIIRHNIGGRDLMARPRNKKTFANGLVKK